MLRYLPIWALGVLLAVAGPLSAGERQSGLAERPSVGEPLRFRDASGGAFRPTGLVVVTPGGALRAALPEAALEARSEDRVDLSEVPLIGGLFRSTLSPGDARTGTPLGPVYRVGDLLVVEASSPQPEIDGRAVVLAANLPTLGAVSYEVGRLSYRSGATAPRTGSAAIGSAYLVGNRLVIAADGGGPAWSSVGALVKDLFN